MYCGGKLICSGLTAQGKRRDVLLPPEKKGRPIMLVDVLRRESLGPGVAKSGDVCC